MSKSPFAVVFIQYRVEPVIGDLISSTLPDQAAQSGGELQGLWLHP